MGSAERLATHAAMLGSDGKHALGDVTGLLNHQHVHGEQFTAPGTVQLPAISLPSGLICMWSGLLVNIPSGWVLCNGANGSPDLRGQFVKGALTGANPGVTGGAATHTHAAHVVTQPGTHSAHVVTQPSAHPNHVVTQPVAHVFTQAAAHAAHVVTQAATHAAHAALGTHAHELPFIKVSGATGQLRMLASSIFGTGTSRAPESVQAAPTALTTAAAVELSQAITAGTPDAHSAHSGAAVDAHSAHSGSGVDAHSGAAVDPHSAHSGTAVDGHSAHVGTAVDAHATVNSEPAYYSLAYIMKT